MKRHVISVLVNNKPGVLTRIAGLFARRGFNIDSLAVGETQDPEVSMMTIVVTATDSTLEQINKQLNKLIDVIKIIDITDVPSVLRELMLVKVSASPATRSEIIQIVDIFRAKIVDVAPNALTIEITGDESKIEGFLKMIAPYGISELARTGTIALVRSNCK
ncbi:MAG: acetolactate synthase small subunit [Firmicutes bacterium]|nr:acetolactate synthase small subunit [Bacillota bacterium]